MAPVEYIPAAAMKRAPTVRTPEFEKPIKLSSSGARPSVTLIVRAPRKTATGGILVKSSSPKVATRIEIVSQASTVIGLLYQVVRMSFRYLLFVAVTLILTVSGVGQTQPRFSGFLDEYPR